MTPEKPPKPPIERDGLKLVRPDAEIANEVFILSNEKARLDQKIKDLIDTLIFDLNSRIELERSGSQPPDFETKRALDEAVSRFFKVYEEIRNIQESLKREL